MEDGVLDTINIEFKGEENTITIAGGVMPESKKNIYAFFGTDENDSGLCVEEDVLVDVIIEKTGLNKREVEKRISEFAEEVRKTYGV